MSRLLMYGIKQQKKKSTDLGFESLVAPAGFDPDAQELNIVTAYSAYPNANKKYIFSVGTTATTVLPIVSGRSYAYSENDGAYTVVSSGTITWTTGSTKRHVIVLDNASTVAASIPFSAVWVYCGNNVTSVANVKYTNTTLKYIHFSRLSSITSVPAYSFQWDSNLTGVLTFPPNVTSLGTGAFQGCSKITGYITIPSHITSLENGVFYGCTGLTGASIPSSITSILALFYGCTGLTSVTIPSSVITIGNGSFYNCNKLTSVTIPSSVTSIGAQCFQNCTGLTSIPIGTNVASIGISAYEGCTGLTGTLTIQSPITTIGKQAFKGCNYDHIVSDATNFEVSDEVLYDVGTSGKIKALYSALKYTGTLTIRNDATDILDYCFCNNTLRTGSLSIPNSVTNMEIYSFGYCTGFTDLTLPNAISTIKEKVFYGCNHIAGTVTIPSSITTIGTDVFLDCKLITGFSIPTSVTSIGISAFQNTGITSLTLPSSITSLSTRLCQYCADLTSVTIPSSVTSIGDNAFYNCFSLTSISIPSGVTSIGINAFALCSAISQYNLYPSTAPTVSANTFPSYAKPLHIPTSSTSYTTTPWTTTTIFSSITADL